MSGRPTIEGYRQRLFEGGGDEAVKAQHAGGKLTARERIEQILDAGSFVETDVFLKTTGYSGKEIPAEGVVAGFGTVDGRPVYLYAQDYTVLSGSLGEANAAKIAKVMDMAMKTGVPILSIMDSAGARIEEGVAALEGYARLYRQCVIASGVVPQIALVCGPCVGAAAIAVSLADFVFAVDGMGAVLSAGPQVLEAAGGKDVAKKAAQMGCGSGLVHFSCQDEKGCFEAVKKLLTYLPDNSLEDAPLNMPVDDMNRTASQINDYAQTRDMSGVIAALADQGDFMQIMAGFAPSLMTGFARMNGRPVGIIANNAAVDEGRMGMDAVDKGARFVTVCDAFNLPIVTLVDTKGLPVSMEQEKAGLVRHCGRMISAYAEASVPKITVIAGNAIGNGWLLMGGKASSDMVFAWPDAVIAPMDPAAAALIVYRDAIAASEDPIAAKTAYSLQYAQQDAGALAAAQSGIVDDIFEPESTRPMIAASLEILCSKREGRMPKKHGTV